MQILLLMLNTDRSPIGSLTVEVRAALMLKSDRGRTWSLTGYINDGVYINILFWHNIACVAEFLCSDGQWFALYNTVLYNERM